ncbi:S41 family peptidase [Shivajiella indica]|uniref:S41 family peptidase n=1 Tax=Shivajiella indica TaxID=872115 RepID=A0ABW5BDM7_9BACT
MKTKLLFLLGTFLALNACQEEKVEPQLSPNAAINTWIQEVMDQVYFWLDDMRRPISKDSDPENYFESLLFRPTDRFSAIYPDYQELMNSLQGVSLEAGYEILLARESQTNNNVIAFITYIKKGSPAESVGLKRGDRIERINGERMTLDNYQTLLRKRSENHSVTAFRFNPETNSFGPLPAFDLSVMEIAEDPNFLDTIYTVNSEKVGYVIYHFFAPGTTQNPSAYNDKMDQIFARFKAEGINHLILDFRYNGGGFVSSAINLGSLIAPNVTNQDVFSKRIFNSFLSGFEDFQNVETKFVTKSENLGPILNGNRVYVITSGRTASASELIINGLKPYMDVFLVGDITVGKNVGSIPLEDEDNPNNKYGILPIVFKDSNKNGESEFSNGFIPNIQGRELINQSRLLPLGDTEELLLKLTLDHIQGISTAGARLETWDREIIGSSLDNKTRFGQLIETESILKNQIMNLRKH